jgi:hypothetical protein
MSVIAFILSLVGLWFVTDRDVVRLGAYALLITSAASMYRIRQIWERKNLKLADQQLTQIHGSLGSKFPNAECEVSTCPAT